MAQNSPMYVLVDQVHALVRDPRNPSGNIIEVANDALIPWDATSPTKITPIVISLTKPPTFTVELVVPIALYGLTATLTGTVASEPAITFTSQPFTLGVFSNDDHTLQHVPVTIKGPSTVVPWGFCDDVAWTVQGDNVDPQVTSNPPPTTKLCIYALVDDLAPYFRKEGIPLQFLELMVPSTKTITAPPTTRDEWVTWIVWRCFASKSDPYVEVNFPNKWQEAIHSYRYNSFLSGNSNFTIEGGSIFDLDQWLLNCTPPAPGQWYGVNCYDQSALVQTALSLGVPYHYLDSNNNKVSDPDNAEEFLHTVGKLFRQPFGYINKLDLVGWGQSDSPFFLDAVQKLSTSLQEPPKRQSFWNHAWVYIRNSSTDPQNISPLDACAGPTTDPNGSVSSYLTNAVDSTATTDDKTGYPNFNNNQQPVQFNGVTKILADQPLWHWEKHAFMGNSIPRLRYNGDELFVWNQGPGLNLKTLLKQVGRDVKPIPVPVESLFASTLDKACGLLQVPAPSTGTDVHISDTDTFPYGPFTVRTGDPAVSSDGTLIRYDLWKTDGSGPPYLSITVVVLTDFAQAMSWLVTDLCSIDHTSDTVWDISSDEVKAGKVLLSPQPGIAFGATLQSNVLMLLGGTADPTTMSAILSSANDFMAPFFNQPLTKVDVDKCQLSGIPSSLSGNLSFQLILTAPGATDVSVASNTKGIHVETTAMEGDASSSWKVDCVVFAGDDYITKGRVLDVSFAAEDTWFTTHKAFPIGP